MLSEFVQLLSEQKKIKLLEVEAARAPAVPHSYRRQCKDTTTTLVDR